MVLEQLRIIRNENRDMRNNLDTRLDRMEMRLNSLEQQVAGLRSDFAFYMGEHQTLEQRVKRIERRLELNDDA